MTHPVHRNPGDPEAFEKLWPDADIETGGWVTTPLHDKIDETTPVDDTSVTTESPGSLQECGADPPTFGSDVNFTVGLPDFTDPPAGTETFVYRVRARLVETLGTGHQAELDMELLQGASVVASRTGITLTTTLTTYEDFLSSSEVDTLLSDTSDMRVRVTWRGCVNETGDEVDGECSEANLETQ